MLSSDSRESGEVPSDFPGSEAELFDSLGSEVELLFDSPGSEVELLFDSRASEVELLFDSLASEDLPSSGSLKLEVELSYDSLEPGDSYPK